MSVLGCGIFSGTLSEVVCTLLDVLSGHPSEILRFLEGWRSVQRNMDSQQDIIQFSIREDSLWVPVYTCPLHEFRLRDYCLEHGIPVYLPVVPDYKIHNVLKGSKVHTYRKEVSRPMLRSYLFAQLTQQQQSDIWKSKSVVHVLKMTKEQQPSFFEELRGLQMMEALAKSSKLEYKREIQVNDRFVIEEPVRFEGVCGYLVQKKEKFLWVVKLEMLGQYVNVEIDPCEYKMKRIE